jgi:diguanylate cyclase (GGDEF)-like protein
VAAIQPLDDLSENNVLLAQQIRSGLFITAFLAVITCMGLSILLLSRILEPIKSLIQATKRIQDGDLATPIVVTGSDELAELGATFNEMMAELRISLAKLRNLATRDELTGLFNRRVFNSRLREEMDRVGRYKMPLSLVMIDIDRFKTINDRFGHAFGDNVLREIARVGMENCRTTDLFTRYGGEEFAMIVPQTTKQECLQLTERMRKAISDLKIPFDSSISVSITVSIGVASIPEDAATREELFFLADQALYAAKRAGRNRVFGAGTGKSKPESQLT